MSLANEIRETVARPIVAYGKAFPRTLGNFKPSKFGTEAPTSLSHFFGAVKQNIGSRREKLQKSV